MIDNSKVQMQMQQRMQLIDAESKTIRSENDHDLYMMGVTKGITTFGEIIQQAALDEKSGRKV